MFEGFNLSVNVVWIWGRFCRIFCWFFVLLEKVSIVGGLGLVDSLGYIWGGYV